MNVPDWALAPLNLQATSGGWPNDNSADHVGLARNVASERHEGSEQTAYLRSGRGNSQTIIIQQRTYVHPTKKGVTRYGRKPDSGFDSITFRIIGEDNDGITLQAALGKCHDLKLVGAEELVLQQHGVNVILHILVSLALTSCSLGG